MFIKRFLFSFLLFCFWGHVAFAQSGDFCNAVNTILRDAPNKFRNVRGKTLQANNSATMWDCSIKVPGSISSRFIASMGLFYEGAFFQSKTADGLKETYEQYKGALQTCLTANGYTLSMSDNFYQGLGSYKKLVFMREEKDDGNLNAPVNPPPHVALEVTYSKEVGKYTIVMFIYEH